MKQTEGLCPSCQHAFCDLQENPLPHIQAGTLALTPDKFVKSCDRYRKRQQLAYFKPIVSLCSRIKKPN